MPCMDARMLTMLGRSTSAFERPGRHCLHQPSPSPIPPSPPSLPLSFYPPSPFSFSFSFPLPPLPPFPSSFLPPPHSHSHPLLRVRSPYLVMLNGVMLLSIIGAFAYNSENVLVGRFPINLEHLFIVSCHAHIGTPELMVILYHTIHHTSSTEIYC